MSDMMLSIGVVLFLFLYAGMVFLTVAEMIMKQKQHKLKMAMLSIEDDDECNHFYVFLYRRDFYLHQGTYLSADGKTETVLRDTVNYSSIDPTFVYKIDVWACRKCFEYRETYSPDQQTLRAKYSGGKVHFSVLQEREDARTKSRYAAESAISPL